MNKWADDERRSRVHHRGIARRFKGSVRILSAVLGWVSLGIALVVAGMSLLHSGVIQRNQLKLAAIIAGTGLLFLALNVVLFVWPDRLKERQSASRRQREEESRRRRLAARSGMALAVVLVFLAVVGACLALIIARQRTHVGRASQEVVTARLEAAAAASVQTALQRLVDDPRVQSGATNEVVQPDGIVTVTRITDQQAFFDLNNIGATQAATNRSPAEIVRDVCELCGHFDNGQHLDALADWMDEDHEGPQEAYPYEHTHPHYKAPDRIMLSWSETTNVYGGSRSFFDRSPPRSSMDATADAIDCLTVIPVPRARPIPININTASRATMLGLFDRLTLGAERLVDAVIQMREAQPIQSVDRLPMPEQDMATMARVRPYVTVTSSYFRVASEARLASANSAAEPFQVEALARRESDGKVRILQWVF